MFGSARHRLTEYPLEINKFIILAGNTSEMSWGSERMKGKRYIMLLASAIVWMVIVWIPFHQRSSIALFLTGLYCTVAVIMICLFMAGDYGARRRQLEEQKTEERHREIADALQKAQMDSQSKLKMQSYSEANRRWKLEKASNLETLGRYKEAARMYDALEMHEKAGECRRSEKTSS